MYAKIYLFLSIFKVIAGMLFLPIRDDGFFF
jgi:hypothetical protein